MALKQKITAAVFAALAPALQTEYKASGDGYVLDVEGYEDPAELLRARDREKQNAKDAKAAADKALADLAALQATLGDDAANRARNAGDIATLEKSWKEKMDAENAKRDADIARRDAYIKTSLVDSVASTIAARISTAPAVILPHIRARLVADMAGETPTTRVLDAAGKPSALSVGELEKEFVENKDFAAIIVASNGSGGGAPGGRQTGGGAAKKFADMTGQERIAMHKNDPAGFARESAAARSATLQI